MVSSSYLSRKALSDDDAMLKRDAVDPVLVSADSRRFTHDLDASDVSSNMSTISVISILFIFSHFV